MSHVLNLIEKQIAMAALRTPLDETSTEPGRFVSQGVSYGPCLLVSRECGAGGEAVADAVGERLGWNVFDAKMVDEIARVAHIHRRLVASVDERVRSRWERIWRSYLQEDFPDFEYLRHLCTVVLTLGHQGNVVLVGRGVQFLLPAECAVMVRLVAPSEVRAQQVAARERMCFEDAENKVNRIDLDRTMFLWKVFRKNANEPLHYDMVLNTGALSVDATTEIVLCAMREKLGVATEVTASQRIMAEMAH